MFSDMKWKCFVCKANVGQFSFPKEEDKLQRWITSLNIDRPKLVGANGPRICLKHFEQKDFTQKNRTRLTSSAVPKPVISHVHCKSFSNVRMGTGTKIIGKDGSCTMVNSSVVAVMSNFSPLLKSILNDPPPSLESIHPNSEVLMALEFRIHITSYRIPPVHKQKSKTVIVSSGQNNNNNPHINSSTKSRTLPSNSEVVGIKKIQNKKAHITSKVENTIRG